MATKKKMLQAAAGNAGGEALNVEDVFSTYLFTPNTSGNYSVSNDIDLDGEGGLVWLKQRDVTANHLLYDTNRGASAGRLASNLDNGEALAGFYFDAFNSDGFTVKDMNNDDMASWTFRKAPKFFDVVTYTGTGSAQTIAHNLGCDVGCIIIKRTDTAGNWQVGFPEQGSLDWIYGILELTNSMPSASYGQLFLGSKPTGDSIDLIGDNTGWNASGGSYVMYLFAHNDGDGEFGPTGDQDIIKCGSYTGVGTGAVDVDLGFEPQWLLVKNASRTSGWSLQDVTRGMSHTQWHIIFPHTTGAEFPVAAGRVVPTATGFTINNTGSNDLGQAGDTVVYMAIRRGTKVPESATEVFAMDTLGSTTPNPPSYYADFPVDLGMMKSKTVGTNLWKICSRLTSGTRLSTDTNGGEATDTQAQFYFQDGWYDAGDYVDSQYQSWMWKRAPGFFDVVAYTGTGSLTPIGHNLGVEPELAIFKRRFDTQDWWVIQYPEDLSLRLNTTAAGTTADAATYGAVTSTTMVPYLNTNGQAYISYLFASLPGISKVGSYTGDGTTDGSKVIDCGFTSGARFILIKRTDGGGSWYVWDTARGIVAGNDPRLKLESTDEEASFDNVDPHSSGFSVVGSGINNINGANYIFYAIA